MKLKENLFKELDSICQYIWYLETEIKCRLACWLLGKRRPMDKTSEATFGENI